VDSTYEHLLCKVYIQFLKRKISKEILPKLHGKHAFLKFEKFIELIFPSKIRFKKFIWNFNDKNNCNFNISSTLGLKIMKQIPLNPSHSRSFQWYQLCTWILLNFFILIDWIIIQKIVQYSITCVPWLQKLFKKLL